MGNGGQQPPATDRVVDAGSIGMIGDDRAVSPVVGVALLIGITVILAFVVGSVLFGLDAEPSDSPQVTLSFTVEGGQIELDHEGGETLDTAEVVIRNQSGVITQFNVGEIRAGETVTTGIDPSSHDKISVVWQDPASDSETILATFRP